MIQERWRTLRARPRWQQGGLGCGALLGACVALGIVATLIGGDDGDDLPPTAGLVVLPSATRPPTPAEAPRTATAPQREPTNIAAAPIGTADTMATVSPIEFEVRISSELVVIRNNTDTPLDVAGWTVVSTRGDQRYTIPAGTVIAPHDELSIASGDASGDLIWTEENVWNNDGDPGQLLDAAGQLVAET